MHQFESTNGEMNSEVPILNGRANSDAYTSTIRLLGLTDQEAPTNPVLVGVTPCVSGDGGSTTAVNLAIAAAQQLQRRVLIVDANQAAPSIAKFLGVHCPAGLSDLYSGAAELGDCLVDSPVERLSVMDASGGLIASAGRNQPCMSELLQVLKQKFELIITDLPESSQVRTGHPLVAELDGVLLVVQSERTSARDARLAKHSLKKARAKVLGVMLNRHPISESENGCYASGASSSRFSEAEINNTPLASNQFTASAPVVHAVRNADVYSVASFRIVLGKERLRSDRSGREFSLLDFRFRQDEHCQSDVQVLLESLGLQLRSTDEVGFLDVNRIGVLLPYTSPEDAWKVVDKLHAGLSDSRMPSCQVFSYPSRELSDGNVPFDGKTDGQSEVRSSLPMDPLFVNPLPRWKRAVDIVGSIALSVVFSPILVMAAAAIKVFSPGPVLFSQVRCGLGGKPFSMLKLRTMIVGAEKMKHDLVELNEQDGPAFKMQDDPRTTRLGRFLRNTSIDELPQLWHVLWGDMSLVGPRPLPKEEADQCYGWLRRRFDVTPGLTCIWQIRGRSKVTFNDWVRMDVEYIRTRSFWGDLKILLLTPQAMVVRKMSPGSVAQ